MLPNNPSLGYGPEPYSTVVGPYEDFLVLPIASLQGKLRITQE